MSSKQVSANSCVFYLASQRDDFEGGTLFFSDAAPDGGQPQSAEQAGGALPTGEPLDGGRPRGAILGERSGPHVEEGREPNTRENGNGACETGGSERADALA